MTYETCGICGDTATHRPVGAEHDTYCCGCYGCDGTDSYDGAPCQPKEVPADQQTDWANAATITYFPVRCNECMAVFPEDEIGITGDRESCPKCGQTGYLMDMEVPA